MFPKTSREPAAGQIAATEAGEPDRDLTDVAEMSPPEHLLPIVEALLLGKPDVTASRLLNMSPRTFSRRVAELLVYIDVETRFQGGVEIARRGWCR